MQFNNIYLNYVVEKFPQEGYLTYEYNPFRNYKINEDVYDGKTIKHHKGDLVDFDTEELKFNPKYPVNIIPQHSYDGSVNLILNDGYNPPRLINSRFTVLGKQKYQIVDRLGNSDTNIYTQGATFESDVSLHKLINKIPNLSFLGTGDNGNLPIGNYHFYFKYLDSDENPTNFVAESGLVSIFIGTEPSSIRSGFRNENSLKTVKFLLTNVDTSYQYVQVYYTRCTSDPNANYVKEAVKINSKFNIVNTGSCFISITGLEDSEKVDLSEINTDYITINTAQTQAICQDRLFFGNVLKSEQLYSDLRDIALRFYPSSNVDINISNLNNKYEGMLDNTYYSPKFIYNYVGYWPEEYYRLGVVFIMSDFTLSSVYNIRGCEQSISLSDEEELYGDGNVRLYLTLEENTSNIYYKNKLLDGNSRGVYKVSIPENVSENSVFGININCTVDLKSLERELNKLNIRGLFFVRLTRIPNVLCQALTIATDYESHTPLIQATIDNEKQLITERFLDDDRKLTHDFSPRLYKVNIARCNAAICPEYTLNQPYYNLIFSGNNFGISYSLIQPDGCFDRKTDRQFYISKYKVAKSNYSWDSKVIGIPENTKLIAINDSEKYSSRAGSEAEVKDFEFIESENKKTKASNLLRGVYSPYLGISNTGNTEDKVHKLIDIKISNNLTNQLAIRLDDNSSYQAISDRISTEHFIYKLNRKLLVLYRGDSYICQYTLRLNRNFNDPSAPYNDKIVDANTWKNNVKYDNGTLVQDNLTKVNLGDLNAILLGMWVTFKLRSNLNLCVRASDESYLEEKIASGNSRGFYPLTPISAAGPYKISESGVYNKGFSVSLSEKWNFILPYSPSYKNDFTNRIIYSDINITDSFKNGFRTFHSANYRDYPKTYGQIVKILESEGNLICVFEHGIGLIPINERVVSGQGPGGGVFINTDNVLPKNMKVISDTYGSVFADSVIKTSKFIYGVDTVAKKIWRITNEGIEVISDFKVQEFLNRNITLSERETSPILGIRNVKTLYNAFKLDVMFTYYDNLNGFEEKAWNLCFNETLEKFITFYSWIPSLMENIDNIPFSFDRNTSKYIVKLGLSKEGNEFSEGIVLSNTVISNKFTSLETGYEVGTLSIPNTENYDVEFKLEKDIYGNYKYFEIVNNNKLCIKQQETNGKDITIGTLSSEFYCRKKGDEKLIVNSDNFNEVIRENYPIYVDEDSKNIELENKINPDKIVRFLNIRATIKENDATYISNCESVIGVITEWNKQFLTTDFWKHGLAGNFDNCDKILPTNWYGKQHPFEFECIVIDDPSVHKIFTNLELIANKTKPESFHYEVVGDTYDFADDKPTMYFRQEALKALYQYNGYDIEYNPNFLEVFPKQHNRSADLPKYYSRWNAVNDVYDSYKRFAAPGGFNYDHLAGAEVVYYPTRQEFRIWNHAQAFNVDELNLDLATSVIKANCRYLEDKWLVSINPIIVTYKNEFNVQLARAEGKSIFSKTDGEYDYSSWVDAADGVSKLPPINILGTKLELNLGVNIQFPDKDKKEGEENALYGLYDLDFWNLGDWRPIDPTKNSDRLETDVRGKFMKVRIRYSGEELAIIDILNTIYQVSFA